MSVLGTLLVILPVLIMYLSGNSRHQSGGLESAVGTVAGWSQEGVGETVESVDGFGARLRALFSFDNTMSGLKAENERLLGEALTARRFAQENSELRRLLGLRESRNDLKLVPAEIVVRDVNPYFRIERIRLKLPEAAEGVNPAPGNAVITDLGLIGRVTEIRGVFSDVMLISDHRSRVAAQVSGTGVIGMVVGAGRKAGYVARLQVSMTEPVLQKGAVVVTSGHDRVFPRGIEIGYVLEPDKRRQAGPFMEYDIGLAVDPATVDAVMVVTEMAVADALKAFEVK